MSTELATLLPPHGSVMDTSAGALSIINDKGVETRQLGLVVRPKTATLLAKIVDELAEARDLKVDSAFMAQQALVMIGRFSTVRGEMDKERLATTLPLRDAAGWVNDGFNEAIDMVAVVEDLLRRSVLAFNAQEMLRQEAAARVIAEQRRKDAAAAAEREAAAIKAAEESARQAQAAASAGSEQVAQALLTQAQVQVDTARADAATAAAAVFVPIVTPIAVKGVSQKYKGRVVGKLDALREVVRRADQKDTSLLELVNFNETALNAFANLTKGNMNVPGLEAYPIDSLRAKKQAV